MQVFAAKKGETRTTVSPKINLEVKFVGSEGRLVDWMEVRIVERPFVSLDVRFFEMPSTRCSERCKRHISRV